MPSRPGTIMTAQAAVTQLGYLIGAVTGATTLGAWGYAALGLVLGGASLVSAVLITRVVDPLQRADPSPARQARRHRAAVDPV
jgi:predicted MFS family arabinose efflux permease